MFNGTHQYDVVIAGAGLAGCAAAITLQRQGLRTLVVERLQAPQWKPGESLPPVSRRLLNDLGITEFLPADCTLPIYANESCWETEALNSREFVFDPEGHGWRVDRCKLEIAAQTAAEHAGATLLRGQCIPGMQRVDACWRFKLDGQSINAPWIIDATGRSRHIARRHGACVIIDDYQVAVVACLRAALGGDHDTSTLVEAVEAGWFYTALLPDHTRVIAYHIDRDLPGYTCARTQTGLSAALADTLHVLPLLKQYDYSYCMQPHTSAANSSRLDRIHGQGWLAIGDTAICFDPISAQGMHTALYAGHRGAQCLTRRIKQDDRSAFDPFTARINSIYTTHLRHRQLSFDLVQRWPDSEYWKRRWSKRLSNANNMDTVHNAQ